MHSARKRESAPSVGSAAASHRGGHGHRSSYRQSRRRPRSRRCPVVALLAVGLLGSVTFLVDGGRSDASSGAPHPRNTVHLPPSRTPTPTHTPKRTPTPRHTPAPERSGTGVPATGPGTFVTAHASGAKVGLGSRPLRYVVKVETGLDISPTEAANEIADILAAPRGWTHNPAYAFQLVSEGQPHDLTVRIATPGTADALCWAGIHQDTEGEYNCEVPGGVVVNLKRWVKGSPTFDGPIHDYRALIINHEMGHFLGYSHMGCGGPGQPAPVMMQQIKGLSGCIANAWPYDGNGHFITGPRVM